MSAKKRRLRTDGGAAMMGLVLVIMLFILFIGLFSFDANRAQMCQREMISACDSASITGTAMLASYDTSPNGQVSLAIAQQLAAGYAYNMFRRSVVLGKTLSNAQLQNKTSALSQVTSPGQCNLIIALGDPSNDFQAISYAGDPAGRTVEIFACYGYQPEFLSSIPFGFKVTPINAASFGGLPQVDAVVVFDLSGSMDDFTSVLFVRREWYWPTTATLGMPLYSVVTGANVGTNNLFTNYLKWNYTIQPEGSGANVLPPQNLQANGSAVAAIGNPLNYLNCLRANPIFCAQWLGTACCQPGGNTGDPTHFMAYKTPGGANVTIGSEDYGQPPGNYKPVFVYNGPTGITNVVGSVSMPMIPLVTSLCPDHPMSDPAQVADKYHTQKGNGSPSFWWYHRQSPTVPIAANNISGVGIQSGSIMTSFQNPAAPEWTPGLPQTYPNNTTALAYEPNVWAQSIFPPTSTGQVGYPTQSAATNGPYLAVANQLVNDNTTFTDLVVNIVDPTAGGSSYSTQPIPPITASTINNFFFTGFSTTFPSTELDPRLAGQTFDFQNLATVVEAARGNLDTTGNYTNACLDGNVIIRPYTSATQGAASTLPANPATTTVLSGSPNKYWQLAYERIAMLESQPYATACDGAENGFFYKLSTLADCRYGLVGFSAIAQSGSDTYTGSNSNMMAGYPNYNLTSQGTCTSLSNLHTGIQYNYNTNGSTGQNRYYYGTGASGTKVNANECWWRANENVSPAAGGTSYAGQVSPWTSEQVVGYAQGATTSVSNATGFKVPRTPLAASTTNTSSQLCMVTSHPSSASAVSPYNVTPYGDVWSSTAGDGYANGVWNGRPISDTYCDEALLTAFNNFNTNGSNTNKSYTPSARLAARKTIVFFTDGQPTGGISGTVAKNSNAVATSCSKNNISLFTIGLNMDPANNGSLTTAQYQFLGDGVNASYNGSQNGLAYIAGNGSRFFQCQDGASVRSAFASIARRLSQAQF